MKTTCRSGPILTLFILLVGGLMVVGAAGQVWASTIPLPTPGAPPSVGDSQLVGSLTGLSGPPSTRIASLGSEAFAGFSGVSGTFTAGPGTFAYVFQPENTSGRTIIPPARIITVTSPSGVWTAIGDGIATGNSPVAGSRPANSSGASQDLADTLPVARPGTALLVVTSPGETVSWNFAGPPAGNQPGPVVLAALTPGPVFAGVARAQGDGCVAGNCPVVPEPGTLLLLGSGLVGVGIWGRKRWFSGAQS